MHNPIDVLLSVGKPLKTQVLTRLVKGRCCDAKFFHLLLISILLIALLLPKLTTHSNVNNAKIAPMDLSLSQVSSVENLIGIGEATARTRQEAEQIAQYRALKEITEKIYVHVETKVQLKETLVRTFGSEDSYKVVYERVIETTARAELYGVTFTVLEIKNVEGNFYVRVRAEIKAADAFQNFKAGLLETMLRTLREMKFIFTAKQIVDKTKVEISSYNQSLPNVIKLQLEYSLIEMEYKKATELIYIVKNKQLRTQADIVDVGNLLSELETVAVDYISEDLLEVKYKVYDFAKTLQLRIRVQEYVWKDEAVVLRVSLPSFLSLTEIPIKLGVRGREVHTRSDLIVLNSGQARIIVSIKGMNPKVSFSFGGYEIASWTPKVFDSDGAVRKDLISSAAVLWLLLDQNENVLRHSSVDSVTKEVFVGVDRVLREFFEQFDLDVKILDIGFLEGIYGGTTKINTDNIVSLLKRDKIARYLFLAKLDMTHKRIGNWTRTDFVLTVKIIDIMTAHSWHDSISMEEYSPDVVSAVRNILTSKDFKLKFDLILSKYLKF